MGAAVWASGDNLKPRKGWYVQSDSPGTALCLAADVIAARLTLGFLEDDPGLLKIRQHDPQPQEPNKCVRFIAASTPPGPGAVHALWLNVVSLERSTTPVLIRRQDNVIFVEPRP